MEQPSQYSFANSHMEVTGEADPGLYIELVPSGALIQVPPLAEGLNDLGAYMDPTADNPFPTLPLRITARDVSLATGLIVAPETSLNIRLPLPIREVLRDGSEVIGLFFNHTLSIGRQISFFERQGDVLDTRLPLKSMFVTKEGLTSDYCYGQGNQLLLARLGGTPEVTDEMLANQGFTVEVRKTAGGYFYYLGMGPHKEKKFVAAPISEAGSVLPGSIRAGELYPGKTYLNVAIDDPEQTQYLLQGATLTAWHGPEAMKRVSAWRGIGIINLRGPLYVLAECV